MTKMIRVGIEDDYYALYDVFELADHIHDDDCLHVEKYKFDEWKDLRKRMDVLEQYFDSLETANDKNRREEHEEAYRKSKEAYDKAQAQLPTMIVQFRRPGQ